MSPLKDAKLLAEAAERGRLKACAERDAFADQIKALGASFSDCIQSLHDEMMNKYAGQKPDDMHPVTRREYDRDMAEIAEYRAVLAAMDGVAA